jgi:predicted GNAT family N-acyltransferase
MALHRLNSILNNNEAIRVNLAVSRDQLEASFRLRFSVYSEMNYLNQSICADPSHLDIDSYDFLSFHIVAILSTTGTVVGTARLIVAELPATFPGNPLESLLGLQRRQATWCREIADAVREERFRDAIDSPYMFPLPVLQSFDFNANDANTPDDGWKKLLDSAGTLGEISRVVVDPHYRGLKLSTLLMRACLATAVVLKRHRILLECIPDHESMYAKFGFCRLSVPATPAVALDVSAIAMGLELEPGLLNEAFSLAQKDIAMLRSTITPTNNQGGRGSGHLCLCNRTQCWKYGDYQERTKEDCPLKLLHRAVRS